MSKFPNYTGNIDAIDGLRPKNSGIFPLAESHDILADESGTRLDSAILAVTTAARMDEILANATAASVGLTYIYIGPTTSKYENGAYYCIEEE